MLSALGIDTTVTGAEEQGPDEIAAAEASLARLNLVIGAESGAAQGNAAVNAGKSAGKSLDTANSLAAQLSQTSISNVASFNDGKQSARSAHSLGRAQDQTASQPPIAATNPALESSLASPFATPLASLHTAKVSVESAASSSSLNGTARNASKHSAANSSTDQAAAQDDVADSLPSSDASAEDTASNVPADPTALLADPAAQADANAASPALAPVDASSLAAPKSISAASAHSDPATSAITPASPSPATAVQAAEPTRLRESGARSRASATTAISSSSQSNETARPSSESQSVQATAGAHPSHASRAAYTGATPGASQTTPQATAQETFTALDSATTAQPSWVHVGSRSAEAGFIDPSLGWVGVRAEMSGGALHASVVPLSQDAAATLGGHMDGLKSYLGSQQTSVASLTLASPTFSESSPGAMQQGTGNSAGQGANPNANHGSASAPQTAGNSTIQSRAQMGLEGNPATNPIQLQLERSGSSISVMA